MSTKPCPKCGARAYREHDRDHMAAHGVHGAVHMGLAHPVGALLMLAGSALAAIGLFDKYTCSRCKHTF